MQAPLWKLKCAPQRLDEFARRLRQLRYVWNQELAAAVGLIADLESLGSEERPRPESGKFRICRREAEPSRADTLSSATRKRRYGNQSA